VAANEESDRSRAGSWIGRCDEPGLANEPARKTDQKLGNSLKADGALLSSYGREEEQAIIKYLSAELALENGGTWESSLNNGSIWDGSRLVNPLLCDLPNRAGTNSRNLTDKIHRVGLGAPRQILRPMGHSGTHIQLCGLERPVTAEKKTLGRRS
jgi:hypothetical protein